MITIIVAIFYPSSPFCEITISFLGLQQQPNTAPDLFQRGVEYGKYDDSNNNNDMNDNDDDNNISSHNNNDNTNNNNISSHNNVNNNTNNDKY